MLCKTDSDPRYTEVEMTPLVTTISTGSSSAVTQTVFTASETWYYMVTWYFYSPSGYQSSPYRATVWWWTVISTNGGGWMHNWWLDLYWFIYAQAGENITITCSPWNHSTECKNIKVVLYDGYGIPHGDTFPVFPREIVEIWWQATTTLFGRDVSWKFVWWIITWFSSSVTTWSITLWNAVGYLEINYNWTIVKVPYYT